MRLRRRERRRRSEDGGGSEKPRLATRVSEDAQLGVWLAALPSLHVVVFKRYEDWVYNKLCTRNKWSAPDDDTSEGIGVDMADASWVRHACEQLRKHRYARLRLTPAEASLTQGLYAAASKFFDDVYYNNACARRVKTAPLPAWLAATGGPMAWWRGRGLHGQWWWGWKRLRQQ